MKIRADVSMRAVVRADEETWRPSPVAGIERQMLARDGGEIAIATSIVRYAPNSRFTPHVHGGGEEILVLDGDFFDEHGRYPAGTYLRNPPGTQHAPGTDKGCTLFVKLGAFVPGDDEQITLDTAAAQWRPGLVAGLKVLPLHNFDTQSTALVRWAPGTVFSPHAHFGGEEIYVIDGVFEDENGVYPAGTWIRSPHLSRHSPFSRTGCTIFVKVGHLAPP
jgi:anti-sigma factor ChrR (cupin superfamily)